MTTITTLTVSELKAADPKRFSKEYWKWREYALDYDWWDSEEEYFKTQHVDAGVEVTRIEFSVYGGQGSGASFVGRVDVTKFMKHRKLDEKYLPLYLAVEGDGSYAIVSTTRYGNVTVNLEENVMYCDPRGVFSELAAADWEALVEEQFDAAGLEDEILGFCKDICKDLHNSLEAEYDYLTSEEAFTDSCECNEITFDVEGEDE